MKSRFVFEMARWPYEKFRSIILLGLVFLSSTACASLVPVSPLEKSETVLSSEKTVDGSLLLATVKLGRKIDPKDQVYAKFLDRKFQFYPIEGSDHEVYQGLIAIPYREKPGNKKIKIFVNDEHIQVPIQIESGKYKSESLRVDPSKVSPPKSAIPRILKEVKEIKKIYHSSEPKKYWKGPFSYPIKSPVTSEFGTARNYNGHFKGYHRGLDLKAGVGTPINAPARGKVVLAKSLYYTGGTVLLDHGYGLITLYAHLSKIQVKTGAMVDRGQLLGLAGATGRVTGPHLHWGAVLSSVKVNPMGLIRTLR